MKVQNIGEANFLLWCEQEGLSDDEEDALEWLETYRSMLRAFNTDYLSEEEYAPGLALYFSRYKGK